MKRYLSMVSAIFVLSACANNQAVQDNKQYSNLPLTENAMNAPKWSALERFPARYPIAAAKKRVEGCATIEYVITPLNEIKSMKVISATQSYFAESAVNVLSNWKWAQLPKNLTSEPIKTQTRFDFCLNKPNVACETVKPEYSCPSTDIIYSSGSVIKVQRV